MNIRKQRLLTAGPTPLYPKALQAMMGADVHHRTEDFRELTLSVLADLKTLLGTSNDVLILTASGTGAMEASVTNCFSPGDRVIVCSAGKFGERWVEMTRAYGLDVTVLNAPYGSSVEAPVLETALAAAVDRFWPQPRPEDFEIHWLRRPLRIISNQHNRNPRVTAELAYQEQTMRGGILVPELAYLL